MLGLRQTFIEKGFHKVATEDQTPLVDCYLPTPWNQIEAGMAFMDNLPMLIVKEAGVAGGVFNVGSTDKFIHQAELTPEYLASQRFLQPFNSWQQEVTLLAHSRSHVKAN